MPANPNKWFGYRTCRLAVLCCRLIVLFILSAVACPPCNVAQATPPILAQATPATVPANFAEFQVKAAYLYKFGSYIEWPPNTFPTSESPVTIGVRGADALANELIHIAIDHTVNGRPVLVRKLGAGDALTGINVLFIGSEHREHYADILATTKGLPILTVTEAEQSLTHGSMINFVLVDGRVRFEAAPKAAKQNSLTISARLLAAAYKIAEGP